MGTREKTGQFTINSFNFTLTCPEKTKCKPPCPKKCLLYNVHIVSFTAPPHQLHTLLRTQSGWVGGTWPSLSNCQPRMNMRSHMNTLYTLYHVHPTYTCAYTVLQREIIFRLIRKLKRHKIHLPPHTHKQPHHTISQSTSQVYGCRCGHQL